MSDTNYSPWGDPIWLTIRRSAWVHVDPWYGEHDPSEARNIRVRRFWFPHFSVANRWFHFYIGWKPIAVPRHSLPGFGDPKFYWWPLVSLKADELAVQWSHRFGFGRAR